MIVRAGGEEKSLRAWDVGTGACEVTVPGAHAVRVKALTKVAPGVVASGATDGSIRLWRVEGGGGGGAGAAKASLQLLVEIATRMRLTALSSSGAALRAQVASGGAAAAEEEEGEDEEEEGEEEEGEKNRRGRHCLAI